MWCGEIPVCQIVETWKNGFEYCKQEIIRAVVQALHYRPHGSSAMGSPTSSYLKKCRCRSRKKKLCLGIMKSGKK